MNALRYLARFEPAEEVAEVEQVADLAELNINEVDEVDEVDRRGKREKMKEIGLTAKLGARGRVKIEAMTKSFDSRRVGQFLETCTDRDTIQAFKNLSTWLESYLTDESRSSYTSQFDEGWFWRGLADSHPEFIDFMVSTDERKFLDENKTRVNPFFGMPLTEIPFMKALNVFFMVHYLPPTASALDKKKKLCTVVRVRDRASVMKWLSVAPQGRRESFKRVAEAMVTAKLGAGIINAVDNLVYQVC